MGAPAPTSDPQRRPCSVRTRSSSDSRRLIGPRRLARHLCASADTRNETHRRRDVRTRVSRQRERRRRRLASSCAQRRRASCQRASITWPLLSPLLSWWRLLTTGGHVDTPNTPLTRPTEHTTATEDVPRSLANVDAMRRELVRRVQPSWVPSAAREHHARPIRRLLARPLLARRDRTSHERRRNHRRAHRRLVDPPHEARAGAAPPTRPAPTASPRRARAARGCTGRTGRTSTCQQRRARSRTRTSRPDTVRYGTVRYGTLVTHNLFALTCRRGAFASSGRVAYRGRCRPSGAQWGGSCGLEPMAHVHDNVRCAGFDHTSCARYALAASFLGLAGAATIQL